MKKKKPIVKSNILSIDVGLNYLGACATNQQDHFLLDGRLLKSWSFFYMKKAHNIAKINPESKRINKYKQKNYNYIKQYIFKVICYLKKYCKDNKIHTLLIGIIPTKKIHKPNMFFNMRYDFENVNAYIVSYMYYAVLDMAQELKLAIVQVNEENTSRSSFYDQDSFTNPSNSRACRGRFKTVEGKSVHADINASLNFFRKNMACMKLLNFKESRERLLLFPRKVYFPDK